MLVDSKYFEVCCFVIYVGLRSILLFTIPITQTSDQHWYYWRAVDIASSATYSEDGLPTAFWPVGWPGLLGCLFSLFGANAIYGQIANLFLSALIFFLVLKIGGEFFGDRRVGRLAVLLLAVYPNQISYIPVLATEIFYEFLILCGVYFLSRAKTRWTLLAGLVFGVATLTKAQTPPLVAFLLVAAWLFAHPRPHPRQLLKTLGTLYLALGLTVLPWTLRNYTVFQEIIPVSTNGGLNLLIGNHPSANGTYKTVNLNDPILDEPAHRIVKQVEIDRVARAKAISWIINHPGEFIALLPQKVWHLWGPDGEGEWYYQAGHHDYDKNIILFRIVRSVNQIYYTFLLSFAGLSLVSFRQPLLQTVEGSPWKVSGWVIIAYFTLISTVFFGSPRFHFPLMPWVVMYASWTIARIIAAQDTTSWSVFRYDRTLKRPIG